MPRRNSNAQRRSKTLGGHLNNPKSRGVGTDVQGWISRQGPVEHHYVNVSPPSDAPKPAARRRTSRKAA